MIDSHYRSARGQSGIFAGKGSFDIYVEKNTDLKGAIIASEADAGKNRLSTVTFSFSDLENGADYSVDSIGATLHTTSQLKRDDNGFIRRHYGTALSPDIGITINDDATSSTKSAVAPGVIPIRSNEKDAIGQIFRSAENSLNALDKIFDKETVKEKKELAEVFAQTMNQSIGDLAEHMRRNARTPEERAKWADGNENILLLRALGSGLASSLGGKGFLSGAVGSAAQDIFAKEISKIHDDNLQLLAGMLVGGAAAKLLGGNVRAGNEAAFQAIKYNRHGHRRYYDGEVTYHNKRYYQYDAKKDLDVIWKGNIELVKRGGTIERINGEIISQSEAESLIKEIKGTILRVEGGHMKGTNPHKFPHINYITQDGKKGTIRILEVIRANESEKF